MSILDLKGKLKMDKFGWTIVQTTQEIYHTYLNELEDDLRCFLDETIIAEYYFLAMNIHDEKVFGGFAIDKQFIKGLFALNKNNGKKLFERQLNIAKATEYKFVYLNCIGNKLKEFYEEFGFEIYAIARWDERLACKKWNSKRFGMPNIYYMKKEL